MTGVTAIPMHRRRAAIAPLAVLIAGVADSTLASSPPLSLEDLAAAHRVVEEVRWRHRAPLAAGAEFAAAFPDAGARVRAEDPLRQTSALESLYRVRVTASDLERELTRMARASGDPARLAEMWRALGDDPVRIGEVLARPLVVSRLLRERFETDPRFHAGERARIERALAGAANPQELRTLSPEPRWNESDVPVHDAPRALRHMREGAIGALTETETAFAARVVLGRSGGRLRYATASWPKASFESWWAGARSGYAPTPSTWETATRLPEITASGCTPDTWSAMNPDSPEPLSSVVAVWNGTEAIYLGVNVGGLPWGARYDPAIDAWTPISTSGAPQGASAAFWTGTQLIAWSANPPTPRFPAGARYQPATDTWTPMSVSGAPVGMLDAAAAWTGSALIVWGGTADYQTFSNAGARYSPATDTWTPMSTTGAPSARARAAGVWTGSRFVVWGGQSVDALGDDLFFDTGGRYDPATDSWQTTATAGAPPARAQATAVWTGTEALFWGGFDTASVVDSGGRYNPATNNWSTITKTRAPAARTEHTAVWTGSRMIVWGGFTDATGTKFNDGGLYDPAANHWDDVATTGAPIARDGHAAVWSGTRMIVFGGLDQDSFSLDSGGRYDPVAGAWTSTFRDAAIPTGRNDHVTAWTGSELLVWGGPSDASPAGARYEPATDSWTAMSASGAPATRERPAAAWTGDRLVVWGGSADNAQGIPTLTAGGGRYDVATDTWQPMTLLGEPALRFAPATSWSGRYLVIYGGSDPFGTPIGTGGRYDPVADAWSQLSTAGAIPRSDGRAVWSGSDAVVLAGSIPSGQNDNIGQRYDPASDSWKNTSAPSGLGGPKGSLLVVRAGREAVTYGGFTLSGNVAGLRYNMDTNSWIVMSQAGAPDQAEGAVGVYQCGRLTTHAPPRVQQYAGQSAGGRYDPVADVWSPRSDVGAPAGLSASGNIAVTDGTRMYVWLIDKIGHAYCGCASPAPTVLNGSSLNLDRVGGAARIFLNATPDASTYDLVRGSLATLRSSSGNFTTATGACLMSSARVTWFDDAADAGASGFWYLSRAKASGVTGTYDDGAASQSGLRDGEIAASGAACP